LLFLQEQIKDIIIIGEWGQASWEEEFGEVLPFAPGGHGRPGLCSPVRGTSPRASGGKRFQSQ
jgi:hypothetical protein